MRRYQWCWNQLLLFLTFSLLFGAFQNFLTKIYEPFSGLFKIFIFPWCFPDLWEPCWIIKSVLLTTQIHYNTELWVKFLATCQLLLPGTASNQHEGCVSGPASNQCKVSVSSPAPNQHIGSVSGPVSNLHIGGVSGPVSNQNIGGESGPASNLHIGSASGPASNQHKGSVSGPASINI